MGTMQNILKLMADKQASDVYLSANSPALIKIEGQTIPINSQVLPADAPLGLLAEVLPPARIEELKSTNELNIALPIAELGNFRISAFKQRNTFAAVVRYIPSTIASLAQLNLPPILENLVLQKRGLILITGATGAGKSTTLAAMLEHRNATTSGHILTIEDPIEFSFTNKQSVINQREVGSDTESMQLALKHALHQAPDVILVGEIRDQETMSAAINYAQSGHLCLATLHASTSYQALNRILSFYPAEVRPMMLSDLASSLRAVVSQRLLRASASGRLPAVEVMMNTQSVSELIEKGDFFGIKEAIEKSISDGSQSFEQALAQLITEGKVTRDEALANCDSPMNLMWRLDNQAAPKAAAKQEDDEDDGPSFTEITLDVNR